MKRTALAGALLAGALAAVPATASAAITRCTTVLSNQTINGPLEVPSGAGCVLIGDHVNGSVKIDAGAALSLGSGDDIAGNSISGSITGTGIEGFDSFEPASTISGGLALTGVANVPENGPLAAFGGEFANDDANYLDSLQVGGSASITKGAAAAPWTDDNAPTLGGGFTYTNNAGNLTLDSGTTVFGPLSLHGNTGGGTLEDLTVHGSLVCGNWPAFSVTGGLSVSGFNAASGGTC
jgi:hypothetical protein